MKQIGNRIICDQDGAIMYSYGEIQGADIPDRKEITEIHCIDLDFGEIDYSKVRLVSIDMNTKKPITEPIEPILTEEQKRIKELEQNNADLVYKVMMGEGV
ncbi:hypothetical protein [Romboutsia lituseburensis]|uniref:hypothetical protein n=1 Tax=Romboutsia lituseburensis TaxID=1537 RepID=UPI00215AC2F0|nr:hypothetical protein [Romboutsia lituseburensis]MCR8744331.1 hypothetical protein [Romboutsia lituseburensis]